MSELYGYGPDCGPDDSAFERPVEERAMSETGKGAGDWRLSDDEVLRVARTSELATHERSYLRGYAAAQARLAPLVEAADKAHAAMASYDHASAYGMLREKAAAMEQWRAATWDMAAELARLRAHP